MKTLKLYYPVKPFYLTQKFGETAYLQYYKDNGVVFAGHNGDDMAARHGQPVYAAHDGRAYYEVDNKQGHGVIVVSTEQFDYKDTQAFFKTIYWHMVDSYKEPKYRSPIEKYTDTTGAGILVKAGDLLGYANSTGVSTGDHLHFGLKPMSLSYPNDYTNIEQDNGYQGAIDPTPCFNGLYAEDITKKTMMSPFVIDMSYMQSNNEIARLQLFLKQLGYFPLIQGCTGYYGDITRNAVYHFQLDHVKLTPWENLVIKGRIVGAKTRQALNLLINL